MSDGHKTPAFVNSPSNFADIGKFKACPFDHPWGKLDDLLAGRISCAMGLRTTMPLTRSTSATCCMVIPRLRGVEAQNEQLQLGAFRVWEVGNSGNLWPMAPVTARSRRTCKRPHPRYRAGSSVLKDKGGRVWTRVTKVVKRAWRLRWCKPASRARRSRSLPMVPRIGRAGRWRKRWGLSNPTVQRVWAQARLKPHRLDRYLASNDPRFEEKAADIIGLYMNPPQHAAVFLRR